MMQLFFLMARLPELAALIEQGQRERAGGWLYELAQEYPLIAAYASQPPDYLLNLLGQFRPDLAANPVTREIIVAFQAKINGC